MVPDGWFSQKEEVPYLFLSANPWACSCALLYLHGYLDEYGYNVYTRRGRTITNDPDSLVSKAARPLLARTGTGSVAQLGRSPRP